MANVMSPIYLLRSYAWAVLKANTSMDESDYGGKNPIVPLGEEPELSNYSGPHIVYGYSLNPSNDPYVQKNGSMTFIVYSQNFATITNILMILEEAFGRWDDSASDINDYTSRTPEFVGIRFGTVNVGYMEGGSAREQEGGRVLGLINIRFSFYPDYNI